MFEGIGIQYKLDKALLTDLVAWLIQTLSPLLQLVDPLLRALLYWSLIGLVGAGLLWVSLGMRATFRVRSKRYPQFAAALHLQVNRACALLLLVEAARLALRINTYIKVGIVELQAPETALVLLQLGPTQALLLRMACAVLIFLSFRLFPRFTLLPAVGLLASFLLEGHTLSLEAASPALLIAAKAALMLHLALLCWWLAVISPLRRLCQLASDETAEIAQRFGKQAMLCVPLVLAAGAFLGGNLIGWQLDLSDPYQRSFIVKFGLVALLLLIAALNKLVFVPRIQSPAQSGVQSGVQSGAFGGFAKALWLERLGMLAVFAATAWAIHIGV